MKPANTLSFGVIQITRLFIIASAAIGLIMVSAIVAEARSVNATTPSVTLSLNIQKEQHKAAADGTTSVTLVPATHTVPGDRLVYVLTYVNAGLAPVSGMVVNYPLPRGVSYRATVDGSPPPLVSSDGSRFGPLSDTDPSKIVALRWQVPGNVAPGVQGRVSFKAILN